MGSPRLSPTGSLVSAGDDLSQAGLTQYMMDIVFVTWAAQIVACVWSKGWWIYASVCLSCSAEEPPPPASNCFLESNPALRIFLRFLPLQHIRSSISLRPISSAQGIQQHQMDTQPLLHQLQTKTAYQEDSRRCKRDMTKAIREFRWLRDNVDSPTRSIERRTEVRSTSSQAEVSVGKHKIESSLRECGIP